jgi:hypothetical protein
MQLSEVVAPGDCLVTRVWGFTPESWGALGFPKAGTADKWLDLNTSLWVVCFVSHHAAEYILESDRGRVLGIYELAPQRVSLLDDGVIADHHLTDPVLRHPDGRFRWPIGLRAVRAWRFQPNAPRTRESLPDARSWGFDVSTDMVRMSARDYELLDQPTYNLSEVPVFGVPFDQTRIAEPIAVPSFIYVFANASEKMLQRLPGWRKGEILIKVGCTSDPDGRLGGLNDHPLARIFGLKLSHVVKRHVGEANARDAEADLLQIAGSIGRPAADEYTEFYFVTEAAYESLLRRFATVLRVG